MRTRFKENSKKEKLLALARELDEVIEQRRKLGYHKLDKPIQKGWRASLKVRQDILRSSEGVRYLNILPYVQNYWFSKTTDFTIPATDFKGGRRIEDHGPKSISEKDFKNKVMAHLPDFYEKYFHSYPSFKDAFTVGTKMIVPLRYRVRRVHVFETIIEKNWIDKLPIIDPKLESRYQILMNKLNRDNGWYILYGKWKGRHYDLNREELILKELEKEVRKELMQ